MRFLAIAMLSLACAGEAASGDALRPRELVHPYPPTGPVEIAGTVQASKMLRAMQRYTVPAFTDVLAEYVAQTLQGESDDRVSVTRKSRRDGNEAIAAVSSAAPDGRTLLLANPIPIPESRAARATSTVTTGLRPVALVASMPYVLIARTDATAQNLSDVIRDARAAPGRLLIGSAGERTASHIAIEILHSQFDIPIRPVAYNGGTAALQSLVTKQVSAALVPLPAVLPYLAGGRIKALAIAEARRHPGIPDVQTTTEAGARGFEASGWFGVFAPARTPTARVQELSALLERGTEPEEPRRFFSDLGLRLEHRSTDAFAELIAQ